MSAAQWQHSPSPPTPSPPLRHSHTHRTRRLSVKTAGCGGGGWWWGGVTVINEFHVFPPKASNCSSKSSHDFNTQEWVARATGVRKFPRKNSQKLNKNRNVTHHFLHVPKQKVPTFRSAAASKLAALQLVLLLDEPLASIPTQARPKSSALCWPCRQRKPSGTIGSISMSC